MNTGVNTRSEMMSENIGFRLDDDNYSRLKKMARQKSLSPGIAARSMVIDSLDAVASGESDVLLKLNDLEITYLLPILEQSALQKDSQWVPADVLTHIVRIMAQFLDQTFDLQPDELRELTDAFDQQLMAALHPDLFDRES